jgi:protein SCO1/2
MIHSVESTTTPARVPVGFVRQARFAAPPSTREMVRRTSFPNIPLTTHRGRTVRFYDDLVKDRIVVINAISAGCPELCAGIMARLGEAQRLLAARFAEDVEFYSLVLRAGEDRVDALRASAEQFGVRGHRTLLTGRPAEVEHLRRALGMNEGVVRYGNEPRALWAACRGMATPEQIAEEIAFVIRRPALAGADAASLL